MDFFWKNKIWKNNKSKNESSNDSYEIEHAESNGHICKPVWNIFTKSNLNLCSAYVSNQEKIEKIKAVRL
jgi:hypothetical protein